MTVSHRCLRFAATCLAGLCVLLLAIPTVAATPAEFEKYIHQLIENKNYDAAMSEGIDAVTLYPDNPALLHEVGRAAYLSKRYHQAIYYFNRSLLFRPGYSATLAYLGMAREKAGLTPENHVKFPVNSKTDKPFFTVNPYLAFLEYRGATPKYGGQAYQLDVRAGILGHGYIDLSEAYTDIPTLPDYPDYKVLEHHLGLGWFATPVWLLKARYAFIDSDYEGGGNGNFIALGADWLRRGHLWGGLALSYADYPDGTLGQVTPKLIWQDKQFVLTTFVDIQNWSPDSVEGQTESKDEVMAMIRQHLAIPVSGGDRIGFGYAYGESRYGYTSFGDVLYSLPDKHTASLYLRYERPLYPFTLSLKISSDSFENIEGDDYHAVVHTISLGYLSENAIVPVSKTPHLWSLVMGVSAREIKTSIHMASADLLVTDVIDPITFSDETGNYTRQYAYELDSELTSASAQETCNSVSPYVEIQRLWHPGSSFWTLKTYGRYTFVPYGYKFRKQPAGHQSVWEIRTDYYQGNQFGESSDVYETYNVTQSGRFDMNLHEIALGLEAMLNLPANFDIGVGAGLLISLADWTTSRTSSWTESGDTEVLQWDESFNSGQDFPIGLTAGLRLRWAPSEKSPWFIEAGGGYVSYNDININEAPVSATIDLSSINATLAIGLR